MTGTVYDLVDQLAEQRDLARRIAVALEQQQAQALAILDALIDQHGEQTPFGVLHAATILRGTP